MFQRSLFPWYGGKHRLAEWIIAHFPPHDCYVEVFGGAASVLFAKPPSKVEIYNDIDSGLVNFFRCLRDPDKCKRMVDWLRKTPCSRELYYESMKLAQDPSVDDITRAAAWFYIARLSFAGRWGEGWRFSTTKNEAATYADSIDDLTSFQKRIERVSIDHLDFRECIKRYDGPRTLFYCDPPYHPATRLPKHYKCDLTAADHDDLVDLLLKIQGKAVLSGYPCDPYCQLEDAGWQRLERKTFAQAQLCKNKPRSPRTECLWIKRAE